MPAPSDILKTRPRIARPYAIPPGRSRRIDTRYVLLISCVLLFACNQKDADLLQGYAEGEYVLELPVTRQLMAAIKPRYRPSYQPQRQ